MNIWRYIFLLILILSAHPQAANPSIRGKSIKNNPHNLSTSGPNKLANQENRICKFCHNLYNPSPSVALWNKEQEGHYYVPYSSSALVSNPGQPNGSSLLCLSCHDGTIAMGKMQNPKSLQFFEKMKTGKSMLGIDLTDDHPVSFVYSAELADRKKELADPTTLNKAIRLDSNSQLQCTSCHDPHNNSIGKFLVMSNKNSALCVSCHKKTNWISSSHNTSSATWNGKGKFPWPHTEDYMDVAENACANCHQQHTGGSGQFLLINEHEEDNCSHCHSGNVASKDIMSEFDKLSVHPLTYSSGVHTPNENILVKERHVECVDCHNPHMSREDGFPSGPLYGVRGIDNKGNEVYPLTNESQLCYRCHGDSTNNQLNNIEREISSTNVRLEFATNNPSYHPVEGVGKNSYVPSLIAPLDAESTISCSDCHNNDDQNGPSGPHGSSFKPLLEKNYIVKDPNPYLRDDYALCYKCHSENSILNDESFKLHNLHIRRESTPCSVCHDPHGVNEPPASRSNNTHLINFDMKVVSKIDPAKPFFIDTGHLQGTCNLMCHGKSHSNATY